MGGMVVRRVGMVTVRLRVMHRGLICRCRCR